MAPSRGVEEALRSPARTNAYGRLGSVGERERDNGRCKKNTLPPALDSGSAVNSAGTTLCTAGAGGDRRHTRRRTARATCVSEATLTQTKRRCQEVGRFPHPTTWRTPRKRAQRTSACPGILSWFRAAGTSRCCFDDSAHVAWTADGVWARRAVKFQLHEPRRLEQLPARCYVTYCACPARTRLSQYVRRCDAGNSGESRLAAPRLCLRRAERGA